MLNDALFLLQRPWKRGSAATNKRPYTSVITSSGAAFNSITPTLCLNKGSAIAAEDEDGERGSGAEERGKWKWRGAEGKGLGVGWRNMEIWAVAGALAKARLRGKGL